MKIENEYLLTGRFGHWPSFHDAEVIRVRFEREGADAPFMECDIHLFEVTSEVDERGCYILKNHTQATLRFCGIDLEHFGGWNGQNVLFDLTIEPAAQEEKDDAAALPVAVKFSSSYGCSAQLTCRAVKVIQAVDCIVDNNSK